MRVGAAQAARSRKVPLLLPRVLAIVIAAAAMLPAGAVELFGPMPGYPAERDALLWLALSAPARVEIEYWPERQVGAPSRRVGPFEIAGEATEGSVITLSDLAPGTRYRYRVWLDGEPAGGGPRFFSTQAAWRFRTPPPDFRVAAGSCHYTNDAASDRAGETGARAYGQGFEIFDAIAAKAPDVMLWLGDNVYLRGPDFFHPDRIAERYAEMRSQPYLARLFATTHHVAVWDDHDYGPNNANKSWIHKGAALAAFEKFWANPSYGLPELPGIFTTFVLGDAQFFLLDDRYYRASDHAPDYPGKALYGPAQMEWLRQALLASPARFKIVVGGSEFFNDSNRYEGWNHFPEERRAFLDFVAAARIDGLIFLSGDRHFGKLMRIDRPDAYPLYELTCSPLTARPFADYPEDREPAIVAGTLVRRRNFCLLDFAGPPSERTVTFSGLDGSGAQLWEYALPSKQLQSPPP